MTTERPASGDHHPCTSCEEPVKAGARLCRHCGAHQRHRWSAGQVIRVCAALVTVLSLFFALEAAYRAWSDHRVARDRLQKHLASARAFLAVRDHDAAWKELTEAQRTDPESGELRRALIGVATSWLLEVDLIPFGLIPTERPGPSTVRNRGQVAELLHTPLVVAAVLAEHEERADLDALVAWANFLRARRLFTWRRDFGPDFRRAQEKAPGSLTPNLLLGYWQATFEEDPEAALASWDRALASGRDRALVRRFQVRVLGHTVERSRNSDGPRRALLVVLGDMERRGEPFPKGLSWPAWTGIYFNYSVGQLHIEAVADVLDTGAQLALVEWTRTGFGIEPGRHPILFAKLQLIRTLLLERADRKTEALAALPDPNLDLSGGVSLQTRLDEARMRLTGRPPKGATERDEWLRHTDSLEHGRPGDARFDDAMDALRARYERWYREGSRRPLRASLPLALSAAVAAWDRRITDPKVSPEVRREARETVRVLHLFRGQIRAMGPDFPGGISELEALAVDPPGAERAQAEIQFALAVAYARSPLITFRDSLQTASERRVYDAYQYEALDRLAKAIEAGFSDWKLIEKRLERLRTLREYEAFSLRHGRTPPSGDD